MAKDKVYVTSNRRFKVIYSLCLFTGIFAILLSILSFYLDLKTLGYFHLTSVLVYLFCLYISKRGKVTYTRIIFFTLINLAITLTASYIGQAGSVEYLFMYTIGLPFIMFSFKDEKWFVVFFSCLSGFLWILLFATDFKLFTDTPVDQIFAARYVYPFSLLASAIMVSSQLIFFSKLNVTYYSSIYNTQEEALEASEAKSKFLSTMSHEIRTPLNAVIGLSHILGDNSPRKDQVQNIEALNYSGKILLNLLNSVLDFSKMQSTEIELDDIPTDLNEIIKQIKKIHEPTCLRKGISMKLDIDQSIPIVWVDLVRLNQVLNNLISNAVKFTDKGSVILRIKKGVKAKDKINILIEVIDSGIGIPKDKQNTIWEAFTQASNTTNRIYGGTGLGLPIVKSIIEAMGSKVRVKSRKGKGSRFYFSLSLKLASEEELKVTKQKKERNFAGKKILLVDDNVINVMVGKQILEKAKLKVDVANDGLAAVNKIKEEAFDVVLMDIQMPIMDGYTATKEIRKLNINTPILALSASVFMEVKDKISECGMNGFIYKPFDPEDLLDKIEEFTNPVV